MQARQGSKAMFNEVYHDKHMALVAVVVALHCVISIVNPSKLIK